jgi:hypothetical protein
VVEAVQVATIQAGLDEAEFWRSTPYQSVTRIKAAQRAKLEAFLLTGWFAERFAREERLSGPQGYIQQMLEPADPSLAEAEALAKFHRMAEDWGLQIEGG